MRRLLFLYFMSTQSTRNQEATKMECRLRARLRKLFGGQAAKAGAIIIRQRGTRFHAGDNVKIGRDHTLFATVEGAVKFEVRGPKNRKTVSIIPA